VDQLTAKSVNLLTGPVVQMAGNAISTENTGENYQAFCEEIDAVVCEGQEIEERLFSQGSRRSWCWRERSRCSREYEELERHASNTAFRHKSHVAF
jgi:hypothetical protein